MVTAPCVLVGRRAVAFCTDTSNVATGLLPSFKVKEFKNLSSFGGVVEKSTATLLT